MNFSDKIFVAIGKISFSDHVEQYSNFERSLKYCSQILSGLARKLRGLQKENDMITNIW